MVNVPISTSIASGLSLSNKLLYEIVMKKFNEYKEQYEKDQQDINSFDKKIGKFFRNNIVNRSKYDSLCDFNEKIVEKMIVFLGTLK